MQPRGAKRTVHTSITAVIFQINGSGGNLRLTIADREPKINGRLKGLVINDVWWYIISFSRASQDRVCPKNEVEMREGIHPKYHKVLVTCACGNKFETHSTKPEIRLELCSACHPFFTGKQKLVDTAGRIERFQRRYGLDKDGKALKK